MVNDRPKRRKSGGFGSILGQLHGLELWFSLTGIEVTPAARPHSTNAVLEGDIPAFGDLVVFQSVRLPASDMGRKLI